MAGDSKRVVELVRSYGSAGLLQEPMTAGEVADVACRAIRQLDNRCGELVSFFGTDKTDDIKSITFHVEYPIPRGTKGVLVRTVTYHDSHSPPLVVRGPLIQRAMEEPMLAMLNASGN